MLNRRPSTSPIWGRTPRAIAHRLPRSGPVGILRRILAAADLGRRLAIDDPTRGPASSPDRGSGAREEARPGDRGRGGTGWPHPSSGREANCVAPRQPRAGPRTLSGGCVDRPGLPAPPARDAGRVPRSAPIPGLMEPQGARSGFGARCRSHENVALLPHVCASTVSPSSHAVSSGGLLTSGAARPTPLDHGLRGRGGKGPHGSETGTALPD